MSRSKYHIPVQSVGIVITFVASYLGHHHGGREFPATVSPALFYPLTGAQVHGIMAKIITFVLITVSTGKGR